MNRLTTSFIGGSMAAVSLFGCSSAEKAPIIPDSSAARLACVAPELMAVKQHIKAGTPLTAEFVIPNQNHNAVAVIGKEGGAIANPLVLRCAGKVAGYVGWWFMDGPQPANYDRDIIDEIDASGATFRDASEVGVTPANSSTSEMTKLGKFAVLDVVPTRYPESVEVNFVHGTQKLGYED